MMDLLLLTPAELISNSGVLSAFAFALSIIALAFMSSEFFNMPSLKGFAKNEAYELGVSVIILIIAVILITPGGVFDLVTEGFMLPGTPPGQACREYLALHPYNAATNTFANGNRAFAQADYFLGCRPTLIGNAGFPGFFTGTVSSFGLTGVDGVVLRKLTLGYQSLMLTEMVVGFLSSFSTNLAITIPVEPMVKFDVGIVPWIGMGQINDVNTLLVDLVGQLWAAFAAQKLLLVFIDEAAIPFFLPLGVLMRAFPFTRKTGSTIIAVVFAAYFVYPTSILINQRIWEDIANPSVNPNNPGGITPNGDWCNSDLDCASNNCRYTGSGNLKQCVSPLTDFSEYRSIFSMCYGARTPAEINNIFNSQLAPIYENNLESLYFQGSAAPPWDEAWTKTGTRVEDFWNVAKQKGSLLSTFAQEALVLPNPKKTVISSFAMVEVMVMEVAQFAMLAVLFIVIEIVITLTLMKDFALLIGGEPRVLGISQMV